MTLPIELWKPVPGWEGFYEVSNMGRVKRVKPERIRQFKARGLTLSGDGRVERIHNVARIILLAFVGPAPEGKPFARHLDDNFKNNVLTNLKWGSRQDNADDAVRNGRTNYGKSYGNGIERTRL